MSDITATIESAKDITITFDNLKYVRDNRPDQTKTVTPTKTLQTVTPDSGYELASVDVNAIPDNYNDTSTATAVAGDLRLSKIAYNSVGEIVGTIEDYVPTEVTENATLLTANKYCTSDITVNVQPTLGTKTITDNGTYTATDDSLDGYSEVTVDVESSTRPTDWLDMPTDANVNDGEIYLLFHIPNESSSLLAFTTTTTDSSTYNVSYTKSDLTIVSTDISSGTKFETELFASDFGSLTSENQKQVLIKVSGNILTWVLSTHTNRSDYIQCIWNIVEIKGKGTSITNLFNLNSSSYPRATKLRYFTLLNTNNITDASYMFYSCYSLMEIIELDTSLVTNMISLFYNCSSLITIPNLDTSSATSMISMFNGCYSLTNIPELNTSSVTNMVQMFINCYSLTTIPNLDTSLVTIMYYMFYNCYSLTTIPTLDTSSVTDMSDMFINCYSLGSLELDPTITTWAGVSFDLSECVLTYTGLIALFNSLPTIIATAAIYITGNPGVADLTVVDKAIATDKGWILSL